MEQQQYLIDTNAVVDYIGNKLPVDGMAFMNNVIDNVPFVSIITKIEVLGFTTLDKHYKLLTDFMDDAFIFSLSNEIVDICIELRKKYKIKLPDAIIAATALSQNLVLISRNDKDFKKIYELQLFNPWNAST